MNRKQNTCKSALRAAAAAGVLGGAYMGASACGADSMLGEVCAFGMDFCPRGTLAANGQTVSIQQYTALYALLGTRFGGDGRTTFGLPDLRARSVVGSNPTALPGGRSPIALGTADGSEAVLLAPTNIPAVPVTGSARGNTSLTVNATSPAVAVTGTLPAFTTETNAALASGAPSANNALVGKIGNAQAVYYPYDANKAVSLQNTNLRTAAGMVTGSATGEVNVPITAQAGAVSGAAAFKVVNPRQAMTMCIVSEGIYPERP